MRKLSLKKLMAILTMVILVGTTTSLMIPQHQKKGAKWEIPAKYKTMVNPYKGNKRDAKLGKMLYSKYCKSCHGSKGLGDGSKAAQLKTLPGDFSTEAFQSYTDGELYYMITVGRDEMKSYSKKIPDEENIWGIISHLRTLKK